MSSDINLLPSELRDQERKIRQEQSQEPVVREVEYSQPSKLAKTVPSSRALSWWQRLKIKLGRSFKRVSGPAKPAVTLSPKITTSAEVKAAIKSVAAAAQPLTAGWTNSVNQKEKINAGVSPKQAEAAASSNLPLTSGIKSPALNQTQFKQTSTPEVKPIIKSVSQPPIISPKLTLPLTPKPIIETSAFEQLDVNLIPLGQRLQHTGPSKRFVLAFWLVALVLVGVGYGGLVFYRQQKTSNYQNQQADLVQLQQTLENLRGQSEDVLAISVKLQTVARLLADKITWQPVFNFLEKNTVPTLYYTSLAADTSGKITLNGQGPNYTEVMRQMRAFEQAPEVSQVEVNNLQQLKSTGSSSSGGGLVGFSLVLTMRPLIFQTLMPARP
ncbi:MAG: hypothetical protein HY973_00075 [Candidatus Kerfeldbacteria bacterium]|nr:hypothetical protein [Candidatus Kerfeldbacteria bacterium]